MRKEVTLIMLSVLALTALGLVMAYSTGTFNERDPGIFSRHLKFVLAGLAFFIIAANFDYHHYSDRLIQTLLWGVSLVLLALVVLVGVSVDGGQRWIGIGAARFQPSEFARLALIILLSVQLTRTQAHNHQFIKGILIPGVITVLFAGLVAFQKDLGMPAMMIGVAGVLIFVAGMRLRYLLLLIPLAVGGLVYLILMEPYRRTRIVAYLDPFSSRESSGWQLIQSLSAFAQGGFWGRGPGSGEQKLGYLPAAHTDFVYAVIGEELGFLGTVGVVLLFLCFFLAAVRIAMHAPDFLGALLATGVGASVAIQAAFIMCVNVGIVPTKGLPLPFVAYGGTALVVFLFSAGILVNVGVQCPSRAARKAIVATAPPTGATAPG